MSPRCSLQLALFLWLLLVMVACLENKRHTYSQVSSHARVLVLYTYYENKPEVRDNLEFFVNIGVMPLLNDSR